MKAGWTEKPISQCFKVRSGDFLPTKAMATDGDIDVYGGNGITGKHNAKNLTGENIIIGRVGAYCGNVRRVSGDAWVTDNAFYISEYLTTFDYGYLATLLEYKQLRNTANQAAQPVVSYTTIKDVLLQYPPLHEQLRIVTILDEAFDGIATAKANAEKNLQNARALFESHLQAVFTARGVGWVEHRLSQLYQIGSSKRVLKSEWKTEGVPFYRGREITKLAADGYVDNELFISEQHYTELLKLSGVPRVGDIVITAIGTIGNTHIVRDCDRFYFKDASVLWMKRTSDISSEFVSLWLKSSLFFDQLDRGNGATVDTLTIQKLQSMQIHIPPVDAQKSIVDELSSIREETQRLEAIYQQKLAALDALKKSLLDQAFTGKL